MKTISFDSCIEYQMCFFRDGSFSPFEAVEDPRTYFPLAIMGEFGSILNDFCKTYRSPNVYTEQIADECADTFIYLLIYGMILEGLNGYQILNGISEEWSNNAKPVANDFEFCELIKNTTLEINALPFLNSEEKIRGAFRHIFINIKSVHFYTLKSDWQVTIDFFHQKNIYKFSDPMNFTIDNKYRGSCWIDFQKLLSFINKVNLNLPSKRLLFLANMITSQGKEDIKLSKNKFADLTAKPQMSQISHAGRKIALVDIDDVLANTTPAMLDEVNNKLKANYTMEAMTSYYLWQNFPISKEDIYQIAISPSIVESLEPLLGALEGMDRLKKSDYFVWIITARPEKLKQITCDWLAKHGFEYDKLTMDSLAEHRAKLVSQEIELAIEDRYETARTFAEISKCVYLFRKPWNKEKSLPNNVIQINSWDEILP